MLYGGQLPGEFFAAMENDLVKIRASSACNNTLQPAVDLLFVMGTSLTVGPANMVPAVTKKTCARVVINREEVGREVGLQFGEEAVRDVFVGEDIDKACLDLVIELGWLPDLAVYADEMAPQSQALLRAACADNE